MGEEYFWKVYLVKNSFQTYVLKKITAELTYDDLVRVTSYRPAELCK